METIAPSGRHSFQWKPFPLVEAIRFSVNCFLSFQWKPFLQRKPLTFSRNNLFQQKLLLLIDGISFIGSYSFYWKPFILVGAIPFSFFRKAFVFEENHCPQLKPILLKKSIRFSGSMVKDASFNRNFSFQWKPFLFVFQNFYQQKLPEVMHSHSWRSLSELTGVFRTQSSIWDKGFLKNLLTASFCKKSCIVDVRMGSKYVSGVALVYSIWAIRILA